MNPQLKQRLVGTIVLVILAVIFLPMILKRPAPTRPEVEVQDIKLVPYQQEQKQAITIPPEVISRHEADMENTARSEDKRTTNDAPKVPNKISEQKPIIDVKTDVKPRTQPSVKPALTTNVKDQWAIQLGSFSSKPNADRLVKRLEMQAYKAYLESIQSGGKPIYRVRIGPLTSKIEAGKIKQKVDQQEKLKTLIVPFIQ